MAPVLEEDLRRIRASALHKIDLRLIPFLFVLYVVAWLDRVNVGFAALQMNADLHFTSAAFGLGAGAFFVGYSIFEVPSNLVLARVGARLWISRIMVTWGAISAGMMFVHTATAFCILRFLLGAAEAGFFPGVVYYLSRWYPADHRARAISRFMTAVPVTAVVGGPLSGYLLGLKGQHGLAGWQWLFLGEGVPAILLGILVLFVLTDSPAQADWLTPTERECITTALANEESSLADKQSIRQALLHPRIWLLGFIFLLVALGFYGYSFFAPLVIKALTNTGDQGVGWITAAIGAATIVFMLLNGLHSDQTGERSMHIAVPLALMGVGYIGCAFVHAPWLGVAALALVPIGHCSSYGPFWSAPSRFLSGRAAAAGTAMVVTIANIGGFIGPTLIGELKYRTGAHTTSFIILGALAIAAGALALLLPRDHRSPNAPPVVVR